MRPAAQKLLETEARAIARASARLGAEFERAVELILDSSGKVVTCGIGKSGFMARKLAAMLSSTGTPAVYLHPGEAVHGDLGVVEPGDVVVLVSKSGSTEELVRLLPRLEERGTVRIGILGQVESVIGRGCEAVLDASVEEEGDPHNLVPAASTIVAVALGDALAVALMEAREFSPADFGVFHPGGQLGRNLRLSVREAMHEGEAVPWVGVETSLREVVIAMTKRPLGAACVVTAEGGLAGLVTEGDLRRALEQHEEIRGLTAGEVMTARPLTVRPEATLREALRLMENRPRQLSVLPVVAGDGRAVGLLRLHDIYGGRR